MPDFTTYLLNFGVLGLVVAALFSGLLFTKGYVDELKERFAKDIAKLEDAHKKEVDEYKHALALERQRSDIGVNAGVVLRDIASEIRKELQQ